MEKVKKAGIRMELYERYDDDSDQVVKVPPPGSRYDHDIVYDYDYWSLNNEMEDENLARILK